jgi:hypothetical protein
MPSKKHVTALGVPIDMAALRAKNEKVRAVGNMNVNARGDVIDSNNRVINDNTKRVNTMYNKTVQQQRTNPKPVRPRAEPINREMSSRELKEFGDDPPNPKK